LGLWVIWGPDEWTPAYQNDLIVSEYVKMNNTNATYMSGNIANNTKHITDYGGDLSVGIFADQVHPDDNSVAYPTTIVGDDTFNFDFHKVLSRYAQLQNYQDAEDLLDEIIEDLQNYHMLDEGFLGYDLLDEGFSDFGSSTINSRYEALVSHAIAKIRERDQIRPIIINHNFHDIYNSSGTPQVDRDFARDLFLGIEAPGWNIFEHFDYNLKFTTEEDPSQQEIDDSYFGSIYHRILWINQNRHLRDLSHKMEKYTDSQLNSENEHFNEDFAGPDPEWWWIIQARRRTVADGQDMVLELGKRRPTEPEYGMQAYVGLAAGAKGIGEYRYNSKDEFYHGLISWDISNPTPGNYRPLFGEGGVPDAIADNEPLDFDEPYDAISSLYGHLTELLPIMRELRWWWLADGVDDSFTDPNRPSYIHSSLVSTAVADSERHDGLEIGERFHLWQILDDVDTFVGPSRGGGVTNEDWYSDIVVGLFDKPGIDDAEYYLLVNTQSNQWENGYVIDETFEWFRLRFGGLTEEPVISTVWSPQGVTYAYTDNFIWEPDEAEGEATIQVYLDPGQAILLKLEPENENQQTVITQDITGFARYTNPVTINNANEVDFDGHFIFEDGLTVTADAELTISAGSTIEFGTEQTLFIEDGAELVVNGTDGSEVIFDHIEDGTDDLWGGIYPCDDYGEIDINYAIIRNGSMGVRVEGTGDDEETVTLTHTEIAYCENAAYAWNAYRFIIEYGYIHHSRKGFFGSHPSAGHSWYAMKATTFENIDEIGVEFSNIYRGYVIASTFQNIGIHAIKSNNLELYINGEDNSPNFPYPTVIRYCGLDDDETFASAIWLDNTDVQELNHIDLYENAQQAIVFINNSQEIASPTNNRRNLIANNTLKIDPQGGAKWQVIIGAGCDFDFPSGYYDMFYDWDDGGIDDPKLFCLANGGTLDITGNWWKTLTTVQQVKENIYNASSATITVSPILENPYHDGDDYWNIMEDGLSPEASALIRAYALIDTNATEDDIERASAIFTELAENNYAPAIHGLSSVARLQRERPQDRIYDLNEIYHREVDSDFERFKDFHLGTIWLKDGEYDESIDYFEELAEGLDNEMDSLIAELEIQEAIRLRSIAHMNNRLQRGPQSAGIEEATIALVNSNIKNIKKEMANILNNNSNGENQQIPTEFNLGVAYPNPFNPTTTVPFTLPADSKVKISIFNILGQNVETLINKRMDAGYHHVTWDGTSQHNIPVSSGIYFINMEAGSFVKTQKIVMLK
ncbi:MAG: T9SS type A sorting domain-containing protein, partial [Candidatus Electryonea clarkiae]|nr:T9SS type A sorting domain-containing protein [Candidatus Electryonea clarkiae]